MLLYRCKTLRQETTSIRMLAKCQSDKTKGKNELRNERPKWCTGTSVGGGKGKTKTSLTKEAEKTTTFIDPTEDWQTGDLSPTVRVTQRCGEHYYEAGGGYGVDG